MATTVIRLLETIEFKHVNNCMDKNKFLTALETHIVPESAACELKLFTGIFSIYNIVPPSMMYRAICASEIKRLFREKKVPLR
jgi:hypothetical protein